MTIKDALKCLADISLSFGIISPSQFQLPWPLIFSSNSLVWQASDGGVLVFQIKTNNRTQFLMSWISCIPGTCSSRKTHTFIHSKPYLNAEGRVMLQTRPHNTLTLKAISIMSIKPLSSSSSSSSDILTSSSMLYSSSFSSTMIGEYIGMESCVDLNIDIECDQEVIRDQRHDLGRRKRDHDDQRCMMKRKEFPPPMTSLARTENQPSSHLPWVLKRYYTNDGRLILREEKVKHHEYFKAHRSNGRLTLQLVSLDEDDPICNGNESENENENDGFRNINKENKDNEDDENDDFVTDQFDLVQLASDNLNKNENENEYDSDKKETDMIKLTSLSPMNESLSPISSDNGKCLIYNDVRKITPYLIIEVPAIRPVH